MIEFISQSKPALFHAMYTNQLNTTASIPKKQSGASDAGIHLIIVHSPHQQPSPAQNPASLYFSGPNTFLHGKPPASGPQLPSSNLLGEPPCPWVSSEPVGLSEKKSLQSQPLPAAPATLLGEPPRNLLGKPPAIFLLEPPRAWASHHPSAPCQGNLKPHGAVTSLFVFENIPSALNLQQNPYKPFIYVYIGTYVHLCTQICPQLCALMRARERPRARTCI